jgi:hypothetical protein
MQHDKLLTSTRLFKPTKGLDKLVLEMKVTLPRVFFKERQKSRLEFVRAHQAAKPKWF